MRWRTAVVFTSMVRLAACGGGGSGGASSGATAELNVAIVGGVTLLVPYSFPDYWVYVLPLALLHVQRMLQHSANSHAFFVQNIVMLATAGNFIAIGHQ